MGTDSNLKSSYYSYTGALAQYKPKNLEEYVQHRYEWIKLLFQNEFLQQEDEENPDNLNESEFVSQNFPNPFSSGTEIIVFLPEKPDLSVTVTNPLGQVVQTLEHSFNNKGKHAIRIDLTGKPDGIYFIIVFSDQKELGKIKAIKMN